MIDLKEEWDGKFSIANGKAIIDKQDKGMEQEICQLL